MEMPEGYNKFNQVMYDGDGPMLGCYVDSHTKACDLLKEMAEALEFVSEEGENQLYTCFGKVEEVLEKFKEWK